MKWVLRLFGLLIALLIVAGVIGYMYIETVIVDEVETVASRELGVPVDINGLTINWLNKSVTARNIKINNPEGFEAPYFMKTPRIDIQLSEKILNDPIIVDSIHISGVTVYYEVNPLKGNNLRAIQKNLLRASQSKPKTSSKKSKKVVIADVKITDSVLVPALSIGGQKIGQSVPIPLIHLRNLGSEKNPATSREVISRVMTALTGSVQNSALPKLILNDVTDGAIEGINKAKDAIGGAIDGLFGK